MCAHVRDCNPCQGCARTAVRKHHSLSAVIPCADAVGALAAANYQTVGLEVAPTAAAAATEYLTSQPGIGGKWQMVEGDFFTHAPAQQYDLIYDCTFLCAIPPESRAAWSETMHKLLADDGELVTLVFPVKDPPFDGGPPFCMSPSLVRSLLEPKGFEAISLEQVPSDMLARGSIAGEYLGRWRKARAAS